MRRGDTVAIIQARTSSRRLPGKVLMDLGGGNAIEHVIRRLQRAKELDRIAVATSDRADDDPVAELAQALGAEVVRGPLDDVLARYVLACDQLGAETVVRITADCPLVMPELVDRLVRLRKRCGVTYAANTLEPRTFPKGLDVEVVTASALRVAVEQTSDPYDREHVTPFIRSSTEMFSQAMMWMVPAAPVRVTLDTEEDRRDLERILGSAGADLDFAGLLTPRP